MAFKYDLTCIQNESQLTRFIGIDDGDFERVLRFDPFASDATALTYLQPFYRHEIPKKNSRRGHRTVWEITQLKSNYKALARRLNNFFEHKLEGFPHPRTFGYIGGRNIRENARDHCGHKNLISFDVKDFFTSIETPRIAALLRSMGMMPTVADLLSGFVTIGGSLPLGLPTSPTIANAVCLPIDKELEAVAQRFGATFSRYADDMSFSSNGELPTQNEIAECLLGSRFELAESKTRKSKLGQAHYVTGLSISDPGQPHVPRYKKRRLRQELFYANKYGLYDHFGRLGINDSHVIQREINRLDGLIKFTAYHEPRLSAHLKTTWVNILQASGARTSFEPKDQERTPFYIYVDEAEYIRGGNRVLALAMAVSQHQIQVNQATQDVLEGVLSDPWAAGNRDALARKGVHFSDSTQDVRLSYVEKMRFMPFEGYVAMAHLPTAADYESTYLRLLNAMIKRRLMAAESKFASFVFEQNDKVSQTAIREAVMDAYLSLKRSDNRHPKACYVEFAGKPNLGLTVPDFLLGVLGKHIAAAPAQEGKPLARDTLLFERIRDKYRLILDMDSNIEYSRRRPI
jgi:hypothetical protein